MLVESIKFFFNLTECRWGGGGLKMSLKSINIPDMFYHQRRWIHIMNVYIFLSLQQHVENTLIIKHMVPFILLPFTYVPHRQADLMYVTLLKNTILILTKFPCV